MEASMHSFWTENKSKMNQPDSQWQFDLHGVDLAQQTALFEKFAKEPQFIKKTSETDPELAFALAASLDPDLVDLADDKNADVRV